MSVPSASPRHLLTFAALACLAACAQSGQGSLPQNALSSAAVFAPRGDTATPPPCTGQKDSKKYSYATVTLSTKGGSFCVPSFGGYGGSISYPSAKPSIKMKVTSSTTDYNKMPQLGTGTAQFYLQFNINNPTSFGSKVQAAGGLTSAAIKVGTTYTMYGQATIASYKLKFGPCYSTATKGQYGGVIPAIGALFEFADVPYKGTALVEVYSGKTAKNAC